MFQMKKQNKAEKNIHSFKNNVSRICGVSAVMLVGDMPLTD